jgi:hypothetical protein
MMSEQPQQQLHVSLQAEPASAEQSSQEIHALIQKLDQSNSTHKDRVRRITRFRNYVSSRPSTPEFYDDDIPFLLLGRSSSSSTIGSGGGAFDGYDIGTSGAGGSTTTTGVGGGGLLHACGAQSQDHGDLLKRSARYAMSLLKYLVCDHREYLHGSPVPLNKDPVTGQVELNMFAHALCCCTLEQLSTTAKIHWHLEKSESADAAGGRSGAKVEACAVLVLLLTRHLSPDGSTEQPLPLQALLPTVKSRKIFDAWLTSRNGPSKEVQKLIKKQQMLYAKIHAEETANNTSSSSTAAAATNNTNTHISQEDRNATSTDANDVLSPFRKVAPSSNAASGNSSTTTPSSSTDYYNHKGGGVATKWSQSQLNNKSFKFTKTLNIYLSEKGVLEKAHVEEDMDDTERLRQQQEEETKKREEETERKKLLSRDPLGVYGDEVDIQYIQKHLSTVAQKILDEYDRLLAKELEEEQKIDEAHKNDPDAIYRKKALTNICTTVKKRREAFLASITPTTTKSNDPNSKQSTTTTTTTSTTNPLPPSFTTDIGSILTTDPNFKPMLFLSLVHKNSLFDQLKHGSNRLECRTDNQIFRLQNLVRDNFALFLRCANGINLFEDSDTTTTSSTSADEHQQQTLLDLMKRFDKMDKLSNTCVRQANNSFTSLLENTTDVRKTQSALSVLERMKPLLEVPSLMKNHLEAGRFTGAVNAYRRILTIKEDCQVELLKQVKQKATELCHLAQRRLEQTIADPSVNVSTLLDAIRDLRELQGLNAGIQQNTSSTVDGEGEDSHLSGSGWKASKRALEIVRTNPPALACLLLQSKHFANLVDQSIEKADSTVLLISQQGSNSSKAVAIDTTTTTTAMSSSSAADALSEKDGTTSTHNTTKDETISSSEGRSRWRYDILDARVAATIQAISVARTWLPRLVRIGVAAHEAEKREPSTKQQNGMTNTSNTQPSFKAYDVYAQSVFPAVIRFVEHATFCSLGCGSSGNKNDVLDIPMSFGKSSNEKIQALLKAPLPPALSAKCATELAELVSVARH